MRLCIRFPSSPRCALRLLPLAMLPAILRVPLLAPRAESAPQRQTPAGAQAQAVPTRSGSALFKMRCAKCHDADGTGNGFREILPEIPDFTGARWQQSRTTPQLVVSILEGKGTKMPAYAGKITKEEAQELASYGRELGPPQQAGLADPPASDFQERFRELQEELERLRKQFQELSPAGKQ
jgi:mono/diheme cytochrome c family protein